MKTWKKVLAIGTIGVLLFGGLAGCTKTPYSQEQVDDMVKQATGPLSVQIDALKQQVNDLATDKQTYQNDINQLNEQINALEKQAQRDAQIIADYEQAQKEIMEEETKVESGKLLDDIEFGDNVVESLDDSDLALFDGKIEFNEDDYDTHEEFNLDLILAINGFGYDDEFYRNPYFIGDNGAFEYKYVFDDGIEYADISEDEPLVINFLGKDFNIVEADSNSITIKAGTEYFLQEGGKDVYNGNELFLELVGDDEVMVSYNGESKTIDEGDTKEVGGVDIYIDEVLNNYRNGVATLIVGDDVLKTIDDGDEWIKGDEEFLFSITTNGGKFEGLSIYYDEKFDEADDDYKPIGLGDMFNFLNFATVSFESLEDVDYKTCEIYFDDVDAKDDLATDENAVFIKCGNPIIEIDNEEISKMFVIDTGDYYYYNDEKDITRDTANTAKIVNDDIELDVLFNGGKLKFQDEFLDKIVFDTNIVAMKFGANEEEAEATDVKYLGNLFGKLDGDLLTGTGVIVDNVESNADNDEGKLVIPDAQVLANLRVSLV